MLDRVCLPVASVEDAEATCRALLQHEPGEIFAVNVIEKAGGAPDKAGVEQREERAAEIFTALEDCLGDHPLETEIRYGTDVAETIIEAAADYDATAIVFMPRSGSRWIRLLTGDVAMHLMTETDRPVIVLPDRPEVSDAD
jgi:nucleotide-binding universal stress UspA family protein